jgi:type I restriction enzyme R subunit
MSKEGWKQHKLRELVDDVAMGPFGSNLKVDNFIAQGVPVIRGGNLNVGGLKDEYFAFVSEEKANSLKRSLAYPDDLVFKGKLEFILAAANYIEELTSEKEGKVLRNGKERFKENVVRLQQAFGLAVPHPKAIEIRDDLALFQAIKARFAKFDDQTRTRTNQEIETAIRQIINDAIISEEVVDVFDAAGIKKPDISILSDEFLAEIQGMKRQNLGLELLKRLLNDEIKTRGKTNLVQGRKFSEMLADAVKRYQRGLIDSAKMIDELIRLAKDIREADKRGCAPTK